MVEPNDPHESVHTKVSMTRDDAAMHLGFTYLREDLQEMRQDIRELTREMNRRSDDVARRFEDVAHHFEELSQHLDQRFNRQTATLIAVAAAIIAAIKL